MKKNISKVSEVPCKKCDDIEKFSFKGCAKNCDKMLQYFKKIFSDKVSPCSQCGIPYLFKNKEGKCEGCRLPAIYSDNQGNGTKSPMGKSFTPYVTEWDIKHGAKY